MLAQKTFFFFLNNYASQIEHFCGSCWPTGLRYVTSGPKNLLGHRSPTVSFPSQAPLREAASCGRKTASKGSKDVLSSPGSALHFLIYKWEQEEYLTFSVAWLIILECFHMHDFI